MISQDGASYTVCVKANAPSIAGIIELFIWFSTALSSAVVTKGIINQYPSCEAFQFGSSATRLCWPTCDSVEILHTPTTSIGAGECWANLFHSPVLVKGYPIPRRLDQGSGLEISLSLMVQLTNARNISIFSGYILIKGYSTILVPTGQRGGLLFWHMVFNEDGNYISYTDAQVKRLLQEYPKNLTVNDLETSRHILGWCANVRNYTGE